MLGWGGRGGGLGFGYGDGLGVESGGGGGVGVGACLFGLCGGCELLGGWWVVGGVDWWFVFWGWDGGSRACFFCSVVCTIRRVYNVSNTTIHKPAV